MPFSVRSLNEAKGGRGGVAELSRNIYCNPTNCITGTVSPLVYSFGILLYSSSDLENIFKKNVHPSFAKIHEK